MKSSAFGSGEFAISQALVMAMLTEERLTGGEQVVGNNNGRSAGVIGVDREQTRIGGLVLEGEERRRVRRRK
jgi:hypothetical protein